MSNENKPIRDLNTVRTEIDAVDRELAMLLERRMDLVSEVADIKKQTQTGILDASREEKVIQNALGSVYNKAYHESVRNVFQHMMQVSKDYQKKRIHESQGALRRFGLIGEKLSHSMSPKIHEIFFGMNNLRARYDLVESPREDLPELLKKLKEKGYYGVNVTVPYKTDIMPFLDEISPEAKHIGAVNTIVLSDSFYGYNTDYDGFGMALEHNNVTIKGKRCAVLGSGGSAHAVIAFLEDHDAREIVIVSRDPDSVCFKFPGLPVMTLETFNANGFDLVVNSTPVGMYPNCDRYPIAKEQLQGASFVMDLIYNPQKTMLLQYADSLGIPNDNGLFMLVGQAIRAEGIWQGKETDLAMVQQIYEEIRKGI